MTTSKLELDKKATHDKILKLFPDIDETQAAQLLNFEVEEKKKDLLDVFQFINFQLSHEYYAISIENVREIIKVPRISFLPSASSFILGLINLRGNIIPVINTHKLFNTRALDDEHESQSRVIITEIHKSVLGILVDSVSQVIELKKEDIDPPMVTLEVEKTEYIEGEATIDGQLIAILNVTKLIQNEIFTKV